MISIREAVDRTGLSKKYISRIIGITESTMYHIYYGHYQGSDDTAKKILDYCAEISALINKYKKY